MASNEFTFDINIRAMRNLTMKACFGHPREKQLGNGMFEDTNSSNGMFENQPTKVQYTESKNNINPMNIISINAKQVSSSLDIQYN